MGDIPLILMVFGSWILVLIGPELCLDIVIHVLYRNKCSANFVHQLVFKYQSSYTAYA